MITATKAQVQELVDRYNSELLEGEDPITVGDMCDAQKLTIVECLHLLVCGVCSKVECGELA